VVIHNIAFAQMLRAICQLSRQLIFLYCDVEVHSPDYATAYCYVSIVPMAVSFNDENISVHTDDKNFIIYLFFYILQ